MHLYNEQAERVGFVLENDEIVEIENIHDTPAKAFDTKAEDVARYGDLAVATWHTHPNASNNLSTVDMDMFLVWNNIDHYIIGANGVKKYVIVDNEVLIA